MALLVALAFPRARGEAIDAENVFTFGGRLWILEAIVFWLAILVWISGYSLKAMRRLVRGDVSASSNFISDGTGREMQDVARSKVVRGFLRYSLESFDLNGRRLSVDLTFLEGRGKNVINVLRPEDPK
ncbi:hypothetical protein H9L12_00980 [Sphingomonas rhizophila]|uniref:Uncharacterized protein n=1 Tax=Sphingomonas rhizophila TaxID=2071607 RepID=A0A7G9SBN0_9SPHN|nr:hypothetical protein [Sphingomonas rhizophila]QNN65255.1 hypothetical protein H9L12_00980 [Sphingomonas rhizophila]